jgi:hypothetical protein
MVFLSGSGIPNPTRHGSLPRSFFGDNSFGDLWLAVTWKKKKPLGSVKK